MKTGKGLIQERVIWLLRPKYGRICVFALVLVAATLGMYKYATFSGLRVVPLMLKKTDPRLPKDINISYTLNLDFDFVSEKQKTKPTSVTMATVKSTLAESSFESMRDKQHFQQEIADCLTNGAWQKQNYSKEQDEEMRIFMRKTRDQYQMPVPLQRKNLKCGTVALGPGALRWFRGVCDPYNTTPCCYNERCQNKTEEECRCEGCVDMRQTLYAEYSEWTNENTDCQVQKFDAIQACGVVNASYMVFIGDSHMRHMYMGMQILLTGNAETGCMPPDIPKSVRQECHGLYMFTEKVCRTRIMKEHPVCGGHVILHLYQIPSSAYAARLLKVVSGLVGKPGSVVIIGLGQHDSFNPLKLISKVGEPLVRLLEQSGSPWPKLIWIGAHSLGILKTPTVRKQTNPFVIKLNTAMSAFFKTRQVTFLDTFNLTVGVASPDGSHYGRGVNLLKARVLIDFIRRVGYIPNIADHLYNATNTNITTNNT